MPEKNENTRTFSPGEFVSDVIPEFNDYCNDVFQTILGEDAPKRMKDHVELFSTLANRLADPDYSYEKDTKPHIKDKTMEQKAEDYIERAYYNSKAFADRAVRSLGYEKVEDMTPEDKAVYNRIISRGHNVQFLERDNSLDYSFFDYTTDKYFINNNPSKGEQLIDLLDVPHEMGHFLYSSDEFGLHPGIKTMDDDITLYENERKYGRENSPLATINQDPSSISKLRGTYGLYIDEETRVLKSIDGWKDTFSDLIKKMNTVDPQKLTIQMIKLHDDQGAERGADVHSYRMMMLKEGIWNPFDGSDVTAKQIEMLYQSHPHARIFQYWDNGKAEYYMNNIAQSHQSQAHPLNELQANARDLLASLNESSDIIDGNRDQSVNSFAAVLASANFESESQEQGYSQTQGLKV